MNLNWIKKLARLNLPVFRYESDNMRIAYAGYSSIKMNYYTSFILDRHCKGIAMRRRWYWQIPGMVRSGKVDMVISEISPMVLHHFQKCEGYILPRWVMMRLNIGRPMEEICQRKVSDFPDIIRKIRKYNLTYEIITEPEGIDDFYKKFYLPYTIRRHGEQAWIEDLNSIRNLTSSPVIITVKENGVVAGAVLTRKSGDSLFFMRLGLLDGNEAYRHHGVIGALYYFSIIEGKKMDCSYLDLGGTRPFLTDGLTKFKLGLGAEFSPEPYKATEYLWLGLNKKSTAAEKFMRSNPIMHLNNDFSLRRSE
jgi:hypothetical protein